MSRTPLFRLIQRSYRAASYSITHAEPVDELLDRRDESRAQSRAARLGARDEHGMSRRQFVAGSAAVAAVAALDACAPRLPSGGVTPRRDEGGSPVLIIGAGIAGLTAGYRLRQAGIPIRIIEAQNRIGGRMFSLRNFFADGQVCELGGELIDTNQTHIQSLAQELGIPLDDLSKDDAEVRDMFYFDGVLHSERDVVEAFVPVARQVSAALATLGPDPDIGYRTATPAAIALDRMTINQWLDQAGYTVRLFRNATEYRRRQGSEAVDLAWRMAQAFTAQGGAIVMEDAYHGWTAAVDALSPISAPDRPLHPHVRTLPAPGSESGAAAASRAIADLAESGLAPAVFVVDPSFCTNGIVDAPEGYLAGVFRSVRAAGGLCIADEVQSGFGRLGSHLWGFETHGVVPDIVTLGKPIGNGHPLGAIITRREIMDAFMDSTSFFSTFGGNTVSCAAGLAVLDVLKDEALQKNAEGVGAQVKAGLRRLMERHAIVGAVRGRGLLLGLELVSDRRTSAPASAETRRLMDLMRDAGVLVGNEGRHGNVLKLRPPMVFGQEHGDLLLEALDRSLARI